MSYGGGNRGNHAWSLSEEESKPFIKKALEAGINFFDTANRYSLGNSEEILGRAIRDFARRDEVVITTKVYGRMRPGPNGAGLSRKAIFAEIDASLGRLGMDYVDLPDPSLGLRHPDRGNALQKFVFLCRFRSVGRRGASQRTRCWRKRIRTRGPALRGRRGPHPLPGSLVTCRWRRRD